MTVIKPVPVFQGMHQADKQNPETLSGFCHFCLVYILVWWQNSDTIVWFVVSTWIVMYYLTLGALPSCYLIID